MLRFSSRSQGDKFSMKMPSYIPSLVLRDPPGSASYATYEKSTTQTTSVQISVEAGGGATMSVSAGLGFDVDGPEIFGVSAGGAEGWVDVAHSVGFDANSEHTSSATISNTVSETFATSSLPHPSHEATAFLIPTWNAVFSLAHSIKVDATTCRVLQNKTLVWEPSQDMSPDAMTWTTKHHIEAFELPQLRSNYVIESQAEGRHEEAQSINRMILGWEAVLDQEEVTRTGAFAESFGTVCGTAGSAACFDKISYVGANGGLGFSKSGTTTTSTTHDVSMTLNTALSIKTELTVMLAQIGGRASTETEFHMHIGMGRTETTTSEESVTISYHLEDDSIGDYFDLEVGTDPVYGTPVFKILSGVSSCPWEPGTVQREKVELTVVKADLIDIPPTKKAIWHLKLRNVSPLEEAMTFVMKQKAASNQNGIKLFLNGIRLSSYAVAGLEYTEHNFLLEGSRADAYDYNNLKISAVSRCENILYLNGDMSREPIQSGVTLSAHYLKPCPSVQWAAQSTVLAQSGIPWKVSTLSTRTALTLTLFNPGFYQEKWDASTRLESVKLQYRLKSSDNWTDVAEVLGIVEAEKQNNLGRATVTWSPSSLPDGEYYLRAKSTCTASENPSYDVATTIPLFGVVDRAHPQKFGSQEPSDRDYWPGDEITITFDETLDCSRPYQFTASLQLKSTEVVPSLVVCNGRTVRLEFGPDTNFDELVGQNVEAVVTGVTDRAGNINSVSFHWTFQVAAFDLHLASVDVKEMKFSADLGNLLTVRILVV